MPGGLVALLDDIATLARLAAASIDDVAGAAGRAGMKTAGVVIDDAAVTPKYVVGLAPERELPIIAKIALGSLRNKLLFLLPAALLLSAFAPWAIIPLLMLGGSYLCYEANEKIHEALSGTDHDEEVAAIDDPGELERRQVSGAIRTDFVLSAEIMAIALASLSGQTLWAQALVLALVGLAMTVGVYGAVGLIVKMDDIGLHLSGRDSRLARRIGRGLVETMPLLLEALAVIGTAAMLWVGGGIIVHGLEGFGAATIPHALHDAAEAIGEAVPAGGAVAAWLVQALGSAAVGLVVGAIIVAVHLLVARRASA
jgi:uncharacterized protein